MKPMQPPTDNPSADQAPRLLDIVRSDGSEGLGTAMLRLAHMAAAQHRANARPKRVKPWSDLQKMDLFLVKDAPGHGSPAMTRSAQESQRDAGPVTTEGDR
ncbi:MAG: hypothetical protein AAGB26_00965 [Planctomycetota bacterium]